MMKLAGGIRVERISSESESEVQPIYQPPIEMAAISDSRGTCDHQCRCARMTTLSRVRWSSPRFQSKVNSLPLAPCGFTLCCQSGGCGEIRTRIGDGTQAAYRSLLALLSDTHPFEIGGHVGTRTPTSTMQRSHATITSPAHLKLVESSRIELESLRCERSILPLNYRPIESPNGNRTHA